MSPFTVSGAEPAAAAAAGERGARSGYCGTSSRGFASPSRCPYHGKLARPCSFAPLVCWQCRPRPAFLLRQRRCGSAALDIADPCWRRRPPAPEERARTGGGPGACLSMFCA